MFDKKFFSETDWHLSEHKGNVLMPIDKVCVKTSVSCHTKRVFGGSQNKPERLAKTILALMTQW